MKRLRSYIVTDADKLERVLPKTFLTLRIIRETFVAIDIRWGIAGVYLELLEAQEAMGNC